jgi:hypothetical protein
MTTHFFDPHGSLWATCDGDAFGAEAFGPTGIARRASLKSIGVPDGDFATDFLAVAAEDRVHHGEEWSTVLPDQRSSTDRAADLDCAITEGSTGHIRAAWSRIPWPVS